MKVKLKAPVQSLSGYGEHARMIHHALNSEFNVSTDSYLWGTTQITDFNSTKSSKFKEVDVYVQHALPSEFKADPKATLNVGITAGSEATKIKPEWIAGCNEMDLVIVSSEFSRKVFQETTYQAKSQSGDNVGELSVKTPVHVVPEAVNEEVFHPSQPPLDCVMDQTEGFTFLNVSSWDDYRFGHGRKAVTELIQNMYHTFSGRDFDVTLVLKTGDNSPISRKEKLGVVNRIKNRAGSPKNVHIVLVQGKLSNEEMAGLYTGADAYVSFTRGEGFGRPMLESLMCETPVIATGASGHTDFLNSTNAMMIGTNMMPTPPNHPHYPTGSQWFDPKQSDMQISLLIMQRSHEVYKNMARRWNHSHSREFYSRKEYAHRLCELLH